jgi:hypothetical protein
VLIRLLTSLVSPAGSWGEGDVYDTDDATAARMIASGQAVPFAVGGIEVAVGCDGPERAVAARVRKRRV